MSDLAGRIGNDLFDVALRQADGSADATMVACISLKADRTHSLHQVSFDQHMVVSRLSRSLDRIADVKRGM